jgi:uncharacterized membrane protein
MNLGLRWDSIRSTFWFVPSILVIAFVSLAVGLIWLGLAVDLGTFDRWPFLFGAGAAGARGLLTAVATSMITVAGVVFSITIVALTLTSSQYTSRVLRNFMRDRVNQTVLGVFVGIFAYCLVVLRTIRGGDEGAFVPSLAVLGALVLAFVGIGYLIHFIHHIAVAIQASSIVATVSKETVAAVDAVYPEPFSPLVPAGPQVTAVTEWAAVRATRTGYVAGVDADALEAAGAQHGVVVRMDAGVGDFIVEAATLASIAPRDRATAKVVDAVRAAYEVSRHRNVRTDPSFGIRQIVDIALKALSPGINDSTTAVLCVDYLSAILVRLAARRIDGLPAARDGGRVITRGPAFECMLDEAFDQIRQNAGGNTAVLVRLADGLSKIASAAGSGSRLGALAEHADRIGAVARATIDHAWDLSPIEESLARTERALRQRAGALNAPA